MQKEDIKSIQVSGKKDIRRLSWKVKDESYQCPIYLLRNGGVHLEIESYAMDSAVTKALYEQYPELWSF